MIALGLACLVAATEPYGVTQAAWDAARARLATLRSSFASHPTTRAVRMSFFEPRSRRRFEGRGAVGVDPGRAMRLLLVGPTGTPALDVWVTPDAWRMAVPAIHFVRRGGHESPPGLPIGFFRSWLVDPLGGRPLAVGRHDELIVRDAAGGTLEIAPTAQGADIRRRQGSAIERLSYTRTSAGEQATYLDERTRLSVTVSLEPPQLEPPLPEAFADPGP